MRADVLVMAGMKDININNQITTSRRVREVVDDFEIPALQARAWGDPLRLDFVSSSLEEMSELGNHPVVRLGPWFYQGARLEWLWFEVDTPL